MEDSVLTRYNDKPSRLQYICNCPSLILLSPKLHVLDENKIIQISGKVMFSRNVGTLPTPSCMKIKFKDISLQDASSFTIKETTIDLSGKTLGDEYAYSLTSYKPIEEQLNALSHSMSVVLNVGWCEGMGNSTDWIRVGDFLNTETHYVFWNAENDTYNIDIKAECYGRLLG